MKYKNQDVTVENLRKFKTPEVYKATYPKFIEFYIEKSKNEKSCFLKIWKYRLINLKLVFWIFIININHGQTFFRSKQKDN